MRKKNYKGAKCIKRNLSKCKNVCKTYGNIQYTFANVLETSDEIVSFEVNVPFLGPDEVEYTSDFVITDIKGRCIIRECVNKKHLLKPMTAKQLDYSRAYWKDADDWGIVIEKEENS